MVAGRLHGPELVGRWLAARYSYARILPILGTHTPKLRIAAQHRPLMSMRNQKSRSRSVLVFSEFNQQGPACCQCHLWTSHRHTRCHRGNWTVPGNKPSIGYPIRRGCLRSATFPLSQTASFDRTFLLVRMVTHMEDSLVDWLLSCLEEKMSAMAALFQLDALS